MPAFFLLAIIPCDTVVPVECDILEVNHVCDLSNKEPLYHLHQIIIRDLDEILDWRNLRSRPSYDWERKCWRVTWIEDGRVVEVKSKVMIETWTEYDRELVEREWLPVGHRKRIKVNP